MLATVFVGVLLATLLSCSSSGGDADSAGGRGSGHLEGGRVVPVAQ